MLIMKELPSLPKRSSRFRFAREQVVPKMTQKAAAERLGVSPQAVSQWERGEDAPSRENLVKMAGLYGVPMDWLTIRPGAHIYTSSGVQAARVPLISRVKAGTWSPTWSPYEPGDGETLLYTDMKISDQTFALEIEGDSMEPEFHEGDTVIIDPKVTARPGDFVVAKLESSEEATFKKYRPRSENLIELVPLNGDWPVLVIDPDHPGTIIGTMIEHRRYRRR